MFLQRFLYHALGTIIFVVVTMGFIMWFGYSSKSQLENITEYWQQDNKISSEQALLYSQLHMHFGYGGFIHNFKNYVLRNDRSREALIENDISEALKVVKQYTAVIYSREEREALETFQLTLNRYIEKYEIAKKLVNQGLSARDIDREVIVDDTAALAALEVLAKATFEGSQKTRHVIDNAITKAMRFANWGWVLIVLLGVMAFTIVTLLYRLTKGAEALQQAKQYIDDVIEAAPDAMIIVNIKGDILRTNIQAQKLFGYTAKEFHQVKLHDLIPRRFREQHGEYFSRAFKTPYPRSLYESTELFGVNKDNEEIPIEISLSYTMQDSETLSIAAIRDVSMRKQTEARLRLTSKVMDETTEAIVIMDSAHNIVDMNSAFCRLTGYKRDELLGQLPSVLNSEKHDQQFYQGLWKKIGEYGHWKGEIWDRQRDGELIPNLVNISAVKDDKGNVTHYAVHFADITMLKEKEQHLEQLAHFDALTGLANRMLCQDRLRAAMYRANRKQGSCALLYIDLDGFKQVNDHFGHQVGDEVLIKVALKLKQIIREDDTASRLGGDEFAVIFNEMDNCEHVEKLVKRILELLTFPVGSGERELMISASIGIAFYPEHGDSIERLMYCADHAMYYCKKNGKNNYNCFSPEIS